METQKKTYGTPKVEMIRFSANDVIATSAGNGDVGRGRGRSSCDGTPYQRHTRTFSSGRNSGC
jgi:hypothetical protein